MNPFDMVKNLKNLEGTMNTMKEELAQISETGSSGGNMVNVTVNGKFELVDIKLDPICVDNRDVPMLQDLIKAAHHDAMNRMQDYIKDNLAPMMQSFNIPGMN